MAEQRSVRMSRATLEGLLHGLDPALLDDAPLDRLLALEPTVGDVEAAVLWLEGKASVLIAEGRLPAGAAIGIVELLIDDEA